MPGARCTRGLVCQELRQTATMPAASVRTALILMVGSMVVQIPSGLYLAGLAGLQRQVQSSALLALFGTVRGGGALAVLVAFHADIRGFFVWQICASALQTIVVRQALIGRIRTREQPARFSIDLLRSVRPFAGGIALVTMLGVVVTQMDKMILSRIGSLESFGLYMLAWTVAWGLSRVAAPLLQAFSPHFTDLASKGQRSTLLAQLRLANQLMSAIVLPPAALLVVLPAQILMVWLKDASVAASAAPALSVLVIGSLFSACSYPSLSVLYSTKRVRPVVIVNVALVGVLLAVLPSATSAYGPTGAAFGWALYGVVTYVAYHSLVARDLGGQPAIISILRDFMTPALGSLVVAALAWHWAAQSDGAAHTLVVLASSLLGGWAVAFLVCRDLPRAALRTLHGTSLLRRRSA